MNPQVLTAEQAIESDVKELLHSGSADIDGELVKLADSWGVSAHRIRGMYRDAKLELEANDTSQFDQIILTDQELDEREFPGRPKLCGDWFRKGDTGMLYGWRGIGKSWFTLAMARALASGSRFGPWELGEPRNVLVVDGEMNIEDIQRRNRQLKWIGGTLRYLSWELWAEISDDPMKLTDQVTQNKLVHWMKQNQIEIILVDNLSTLVDGENDAESWQDAAAMIRKFRHAGLTTILVHHAGKNGDQRGTSKREDELHWSIKLTGDRQTNEDAAFITEFQKCRNGRAPDPVRFKFTVGDERAEYSWSWYFRSDRIIDLVARRINSLGDLAGELGISKGQVADYVAGLVESGRLRWSNKTLELPKED